MRTSPGNHLVLGDLAGRIGSLGLTNVQRDKHLYVCGGTGTGKSKFLENLIRQDIIEWRRSRCGMLVLDPHGSLYDSLLNWLAWNGTERPIIPIDLRRDDWVVSYNLLRQRSADPAVLVDNLTDAMAYVWGQEGTKATPLFARWAGNVIRALYEKELTLVEAELLVDHVAKRLRQALTGDLKDGSCRQDWAFANTLNPKDFEAQIGSTVNRLQRFVRNQAMRSIFGQAGPSLDLGRALEEGSIILVSLATERARVSKDNAELFATLLLSDLWTAAQERGKRKGVKPFYVYMDEFQRFVTPTIAENLDEARGFGLHLTMAHQFPNQLLDRGPSGRRLFNSIMENASSKVVFRLSHEENLRVLAQWLFMGVMDPDEIKHRMHSTRVMEYREELRESVTEGESWSEGSGSQSGFSSGSGAGGTDSYRRKDLDEDPDADPLSTSESWSEFDAESGSSSETWSSGASRSRSTAPILVPVLGKELSHVQFRSLDEQLFRSMAALFDQRERHCVARLVGMRAPVSIAVPTVKEVPSSPDRLAAYMERRYAGLPFALPAAEARQRMSERAAKLADSLLRGASSDSPKTKRRIK